MHIPIVNIRRILKIINMKLFLSICLESHKHEIFEKEKKFKKNGGKWINPSKLSKLHRNIIPFYMMRGNELSY